MPPEIAEHHGLADGRAEVDEVQAAVPRARVIDARPEAAVRQLDERRVLAQRHRIGRWRDARHRAGEQTAAAASAAVSGADRGRTLRRAAAASSTPAGIADER